MGYILWSVETITPNDVLLKNILVQMLLANTSTMLTVCQALFSALYMHIWYVTRSMWRSKSKQNFGEKFLNSRISKGKTSKAERSLACLRVWKRRWQGWEFVGCSEEFVLHFQCNEKQGESFKQSSDIIGFTWQKSIWVLGKKGLKENRCEIRVMSQEAIALVQTVIDSCLE